MLTVADLTVEEHGATPTRGDSAKNHPPPSLESANVVSSRQYAPDSPSTPSRQTSPQRYGGPSVETMTVDQRTLRAEIKASRTTGTASVIAAEPPPMVQPP